MGIFIPWLADAARMTGYPVVEVSDWGSRGASGGDGMRVVEGVVGHHTATPSSYPGDYPSLKVVRDGRPGLTGPLAHYGLGRSGTIYVIGAGKANHAGVSSWAGYSSLNDKFVGIEAEDDGVDGVWTPQQLDCYPRLVAAVLHYMRRGADRYAGHKDIAPGRKIDPKGIESVWMRDMVAAYLADPSSITAGSAPTDPGFVNPTPAPAPAPIDPNAPLRVDGQFGPATVRKLQLKLGVAVDGDFGPVTKKALQRALGVTADGIVGRITVRALQRAVGASVDGIWGAQTTRMLQTAMNFGRFPVGPVNPAPSPEPTPARPNVGQIRLIQIAVRADIDGKWGPGTDRNINLVRSAINGEFPEGVPATQRVVGAAPDGAWGPRSRAALVGTVKRLQAAFGTEPDGIWGVNTQRAYERARDLNYGKY